MLTSVTIRAQGLINTALARIRVSHPFHASVAAYFGVHAGKARCIKAIICDHEVEILYNPKAICKKKKIEQIERALLKVLDEIIDKVIKEPPPEVPEQSEEEEKLSDEQEKKNSSLGSMDKSDIKKYRCTMMQCALENEGASDLDQDISDALGVSAHDNGTDPGAHCQTETIVTDGTYKLQWKRILAPYKGSVRSTVRSLSYPNRRFPHLLGIVAGKKRVHSQMRIMVVIDTSLSITSEHLSIISRECQYFKKLAEVTIVECDEVIQNVYKYTGEIESVDGRGGTSFLPPLQPEFLRKHRPDVVVYFTDGDGVAPECRPRVPIVWCLVAKDSVVPAKSKYGKVVRYEN